MTRSVAVVGGGAVGVTAAQDLSSGGADVTLFERGDLASGASGRAAGIAYDAYAEDVDVRVAERALERFRDLDAQGAIEFTESPYVWFARSGDDSRAAAIRESVERMRAHDRDVELVSPADLGDRFPAFDVEDVAVAAIANGAGYLDTTSYVRAMAERTRKAGATIEPDAEVELTGDGLALRVDGERREFDAVLVAAGAHSKRLLADVGVPIPMKPYRVQALVTDPVDVEAPIFYDATESYYARPCEGGLLVGDGTEEAEFDPGDYDREADADFVATSLDRIERALGVDASVERAWAGLCTATPDRDPLLGPVADDRELYVATGWHGHGFMRSPALGETVAAQIRGGDGIEAFDPRRFDGDEAFSVVEGMTVD